MAIVRSDVTSKWSLLPEGTPNVEFWYPADVPAEYVRIYHGVSNNVPNRLIYKTIGMGISAGGVRNFRNIGYDDELIRLDIVLATREEADEFTNFLSNVVKGSSDVFYYKNNFTRQESIVRLMRDGFQMGESEGHPYSFSVLLRKEDPYSGKSLTIKYAVPQGVADSAFIFGSCRGYSSTIVFTDSRLHGAGENSSGQLGLGYYSGAVKRFENVGSATNWVLGAGGEVHSHAVNENGYLFSTGFNDFGQLGVGDTITRNLHAQVGADTWLKISAGSVFASAVKSDGTLWAWGANDMGQLGQGSYDTNPHSAPLQIGSATNWTDVKCGYKFLIARNSDGKLWGCGEDKYGQLGQGSTQTRRTLLVQIGSDTDWDFFDAGWMHTVAVKESSGDLYTWGANFRGELGDGTTVPKYSPVKIGSSSWKAIEAGACFDSGVPPLPFDELGRTYGVKSDGTLWAWGTNAHYELGIGSSDTGVHSIPILINSDTDWEQLSSTRSTGLAVKATSEIWVWGGNIVGECGVGDISPVVIPTVTFLPGRSTKLLWAIQSVVP